MPEQWPSEFGGRPQAVHAAARRLIGDGKFRLAVIGPARAVRPQVEPREQIDSFAFRAPPDRWPN